MIDQQNWYKVAEVKLVYKTKVKASERPHISRFRGIPVLGTSCPPQCTTSQGFLFSALIINGSISPFAVLKTWILQMITASKTFSKLRFTFSFVSSKFTLKPNSFSIEVTCLFTMPQGIMLLK
jgi:hypothetical protein